MPKLRRATASETIRTLERLGFIQVRQHGSHVVLQRSSTDRTLTCVVPVHQGPLAVGTLRNILRQADVSPDEFMAQVYQEQHSDATAPLEVL